MKRQTIEVNNILCEVIATYHDEETNKDFIIYTDKTFNTEKKLNIFYGLYALNDGKIVVRKIDNISDDIKAKEIINKLMNTI